MTADQAWQKLRATIALIDRVHDHGRFVAALGPHLHAAAQSVRVSKIATSTDYNRKELHAAFVAAWDDAAMAAELTRAPG